MDEAAALKWFRLAAEQGFVAAQYNLAACYAEGRGVAKNDAEAATWFQRAAAANFPFAQYRLGLACRDGRGVAADPAEAYKWLLISSARVTQAAEARKELTAKLTEAEFEEGQRRAAQFRPKIVPGVSYLNPLDPVAELAHE